MGCTSEQRKVAAGSADWKTNVGLVWLVGLFGLLVMVGIGTWSAAGTLKTRPWKMVPMTAGSSPTNRLPPGSSVSICTTSYRPRLLSRKPAWLEKVNTSPVLIEYTSTLVWIVPGWGQVGADTQVA